MCAELKLSVSSIVYIVPTGARGSLCTDMRVGEMDAAAASRIEQHVVLHNWTAY
jgi:hypothetical protein